MDSKKQKRKGVGETEAIRIYVTPDARCEDGSMWRVEPPFSVRSKFDAEYPPSKGCWCMDRKDFLEVVVKITQWKLEELKSSKKKVGALSR